MGDHLVIVGTYKQPDSSVPDYMQSLVNNKKKEWRS